VRGEDPRGRLEARGALTDGPASTRGRIRFVYSVSSAPPRATATVPSQRAVTSPEPSRISAAANVMFTPARRSDASTTMRSPRVGLRNVIASDTVADRVLGRDSQPTVPMARSKSPARTAPFTAAVPIPPRWKGWTGSMTARTRSTRSKSSFTPSLCIGPEPFHESARRRSEARVEYASENGRGSFCRTGAV